MRALTGPVSTTLAHEMRVKCIVLLAMLLCLTGCSTPSQHDEAFARAWCEHVNKSFYCLTFSDAVAEFAVAHGETLPQDMQTLIAWHKQRDPELKWSAASLSQNCDVEWGIKVADLSWESSWEQPPTIIILKADYLKEHQTFANQRFIERLTEYRRRANKAMDGD